MNNVLAFGLIGLGGLELSIVTGAVLFAIILALVPAVLSYIVLCRIPSEYRKQEPGLAFLLIIPLFGIVWNFFVYPKIAASLKTFYAAHGVSEHGDCGGKIALWMCICTACSLAPFIGLLFALASLVLFIVFFVKAFELSGNIKKFS